MTYYTPFALWLEIIEPQDFEMANPPFEMNTKTEPIDDKQDKIWNVDYF